MVKKEAVFPLFLLSGGRKLKTISDVCFAIGEG